MSCFYNSAKNENTITSLNVEDQLTIAGQLVTTGGGSVDATKLATTGTSVTINTNAPTANDQVLSYDGANVATWRAQTFDPTAVTNITNTTASTVYTDGALVVDGGVGVAGNINCNANIDAAVDYYMGGSLILSKPDAASVFVDSTPSGTYSGTQNTIVGNNAGPNITSGGGNVCLGGATTGNVITTGSTNTCIGNNADVSTGAAIGQIAIGANALCTGNNQMMIGSSTLSELVPSSSATCDLGSTTNPFGQLNLKSYIELKDESAPANPGAGLGRLYKKTGDDGVFWKPDAAGPEVDLTGGGGGGSGSFDIVAVSTDANATATTNTVYNVTIPTSSTPNFMVGANTLNGVATCDTANPSTGTWTEGTILLTTCFSIFYNGTHYVAVGSGTTHNVITSLDGATWTGQNKPIAGTIAAVHYNSAVGLWMIAGGAGGMKWATDPTSTWTATTGVTINGIRGITSNSAGTAFAAVGADGTNNLVTSTDGKAWVGQGKLFTSAGLSIHYAAEYWVAVGYDTGPTGECFYISGEDPTGTWTENTSIPGIFTSYAYSVHYSIDDTRWVIGGTGSTYSSAYLSSAVPSGSFTGANLSSLTGTEAISYLGGYYVCAGTSGTSKCSTSTDGITWSAAGNDPLGSSLLSVIRVSEVGGLTLTLPDITDASYDGVKYKIIKTNTGVLTVTTQTADKIINKTTFASEDSATVAGAANQSIELTSNGVSWFQ